MGNMAHDLARTAETAIGGFYRAGDALQSLGDLYSKAHAQFEKTHSENRSVEMAQLILDMAVQKVGERLSWRLLQEANATPTSVGVPDLLDLCIGGIVKKYLSISTAYKLLEDLMNSQTISTCEKLWELLEQRKEKLSTRDFLPESGRTNKASLCLLRMCNSLLRRVSKTHNSVFCGRILVFLSSMFALSERSAVNPIGKPNIGNTTAFEDEDEFDAADVSEERPATDPVTIEAGEHAVPIDYNLYRTVWDLQRFCRDYQLATKTSEAWDKFFEELNTVLSAFEGNAFSPDDLERTRDILSSAAADPAHDEASSGPAGGAQDHFFQPKYLTNSRLFRLQLRDPILRECMLTQFLILFSYLSKSIQPEGCKTPKAKIHELSERVTKLLRETPSDGKGFSELLTLVLERERNWVKWKLEKCPPYEKVAPAETEAKPDASATKKRLGDAGSLSSRPPLAKRSRPQEGAGDSLMDQILTSSTKPAAILESIRAADRATAVTMANYTDKFAEAWDPENGIEEAYWPDKDKLVCWRTLRMAMKTNVVHMHLAAIGTGAVVKGILGIKEKPAATTGDDRNKVTSDAPESSAKEEVKAESAA